MCVGEVVKTGDTALGARLLHLRQASGLTQQQMADLLGLTREAYKGYEKGSREPELSILGRMAKVFNRTTDWLLGIDTRPTTSEPHSEIAEVLRREGWPDERIGLVLRLIQAAEEDATNRR